MTRGTSSSGWKTRAESTTWLLERVGSAFLVLLFLQHSLLYPKLFLYPLPPSLSFLFFTHSIFSVCSLSLHSLIALLLPLLLFFYIFFFAFDVSFFKITIISNFFSFFFLFFINLLCTFPSLLPTSLHVLSPHMTSSGFLSQSPKVIFIINKRLLQQQQKVITKT